MVNKAKSKPFLGINKQVDDWREIKGLWTLQFFVWLLKQFGVDIDFELWVERIERAWRMIRIPVLIVFAMPLVTTFVEPWLVREVTRTDRPAPYSIKMSFIMGIVAAVLWWFWTFDSKRQAELNVEGEKVLRSVLAVQSRIDPDVKIDDIKVSPDGSMEIEFKPGVDIMQFGDEIAQQLKIVSENAVRASWEQGSRPDSIRVTTHTKDLPTLLEPDVDLVGRISEDEVWLGQDQSGEPLVWDTSATVHAMITGETGGGKGIVCRWILIHAMLRRWEVAIVDPKGGNDYQWCKRNDRARLAAYRGELPDLYEMVGMLESAADQMYARNKKLNDYNDAAEKDGREQVENWRQYTQLVDPDASRMLIVLDEAKAFRDLFVTADPVLEQEMDGLWREAVTNTQRLASLGRSLGIHLVMMTQRGDVSSLGGANVGSQIANNLPARIVCGMATPTSMRMGLGIEDRQTIEGLETAGRCKHRRLTRGPAKVGTGQIGYVKGSDVLKLWPQLASVNA